MRLLCILSALSGLLATAAPAAPPRSYEAVYELSRGVLNVGTMTRRLELATSGEYVFESRLETRGLASLFSRSDIAETSRGRIVGARFQPETYEYVRGGGKRDYRLFFDYATGVVSRSDARSDWSAEMPAAVLDKLVYQAQLMFDLGNSPEELNYDIADKSKLKTYLIRNLGVERVETDAGHFDTVKLERASTGSQRRTRVWCASELGWLPVKVEHRDKKGAVTIAVLRSIERP